MLLDPYTAFRGKVIVKEEYIELVKLINDGDWKQAELKFPFVKEYTKIYMSDKIPFNKRKITNALTKDGFLFMRYHRGTWEEDTEYLTDLNNNIWSFVTNIQNLKDITNNNAEPISSFINIILRKVVKDVIILEEWISEMDTPIKYEFNNTNFKRKLY